MKLCIFGATGGIGRALTELALAQGHEFTAFVRTAPTPDVKRDGAAFIIGDVTDKKAVDDAVHGQDAVLCALGAPLSDRSQVRARGTANIVAAMQAAEVSRLICVSALGVAERRDMLPWTYKYLFIPLLMRSLYRDHTLQEAHILQSGLDWTIVCPGVLDNGPNTGNYRAGFSPADRPLHPKISRADVADFIHQQLGSTAYMHRRPCLSY